MKWTRKQYIDLMTFQNSDRQMFCELFGPLIGLEDEWRQQGASKEQLDLTAFGFDYLDLCYISGTGAIHPLPEAILEEDEEHIVKTDYLGRTVKLCKGTATLPLPLDYPVKNSEDWKKIKYMFEYEESRIHPSEITRAIEAQKEGALVWVNIPGGFDILRELMGEEVACLSFYERPELVEDILRTISETNRKVLGYISEQVVIVFYPCEPVGGMDVVALRQKYGKAIAFKGGIDKHVLRKSKKEILEELEYKMQPCMQEGGMVFAIDHRIPNGTPLDNYIYYVQTARQLLGLAPFEIAEKGWGRMAF